MKPTVTHNPAVMQEVGPPSVTLTMSVKAAHLIGSLLRHIRSSDLERFDLPTKVVDLLVPGDVYLLVMDVAVNAPGGVRPVLRVGAEP